MALDMILTNVKSWEDLKLSTLRPSLKRTEGSIPYLEKITRKKENHTIIDNVVDELRMVVSQKVSAVNYEAP